MLFCGLLRELFLYVFDNTIKLTWNTNSFLSSVYSEKNIEFQKQLGRYGIDYDEKL